MSEPATEARLKVRISNLHKSFGHMEVLKGIDLDIRHGEKVSLIGPSGSGKTTLLRCVNFLETLTSGEVYFEGERVGARKVGDRWLPARDRDLARLRTRIGMVFQRFNLFPHLDVLTNIMIGPVSVLRRDRAEAEAEAGGKSQDRAGIARYVRLIERNPQARHMGLSFRLSLRIKHVAQEHAAVLRWRRTK